MLVTPARAAEPKQTTAEQQQAAVLGSTERELLTMHTEPVTAAAMPAAFCQLPSSMRSSTASMAVKTGMAGCMQVATSTPLRSMPTM